IGGYPNPERFEATIGEAVRLARGRSSHGLRAYGEMVAVLWNRGQYPAAVRLEQLWHQLMSVVPFTLFCAYQIDVFDASFSPAVMQALLCAHTHLLSSGARNDLSTALERGMREVLGGDLSRVPGDARSLSGRGWAELPKTESTILWLRANMPEHASSILEHAKGHYQSLTGGNS
ncbi:MAG TPA: MEDS domain-containing protein, partial [Candidatus Baltobacteraceae bacterium]|nr:MEDS domain-containing protein [Candidatus Baltobacteraceae bacterium]